MPTPELKAAAERLTRIRACVEKSQDIYGVSVDENDRLSIHEAACKVKRLMLNDERMLVDFAIAHLAAEERKDDAKLMDAVVDIRSQTDGWPWYWLAYGEKCYAFATVSAFPVDEKDELPRPGSRLDMHPDEERQWLGENGTAMFVDDWIASIEQQNGDAICRFIAEAHAALAGPFPTVGYP